jgi:hypothetical protein
MKKIDEVMAEIRARQDRRTEPHPDFGQGSVEALNRAVLARSRRGLSMKRILLATVAAIALATGSAQAQLPVAEIATIRSNIMSMVKSNMDADLSDALRDPRNRLNVSVTRHRIFIDTLADLSLDYRECRRKAWAERALAKREGKPFYEDVTCDDEHNWSGRAAEDWWRAQ